MAEILQQIEEYNEWGGSNKHSLQLSCMRSGRNWVSSLVKLITGLHGNNLENRSSGLYEGMHLASHLYKQLRFFDTAKYIFIVRDPRDSLRSFLEMLRNHNAPEMREEFLSGQVKWCESRVDEWESYFTCGIMDYDTIVIQYENLCLYPVDTLQKIIDHTGMVVNNDPEWAVTAEPKRAKPLVKPDLEYYRNHCMKWKTGLSEECSGYIWKNHSERMIEYGYTEFGQDVINETII